MEHKRNKLALLIQQQITVYNAQVLSLAKNPSLSPAAIISRIDILNKEHDTAIKKLIMKEG